ncbi:hypothetical protein CK203_081982 [Vitis vinifera]|uniref:Uncharacterized protein n=1 Tax=Vitis vinifera TaxID=29760 RepID=A0A438BW86_VITVI|nr:hypothetical protein CK203_081982 [Vitis vinifera]
MEYSFNGKRRNDNLNISRKVGNMIVSSGKEIHVDLSMREYMDVIDGDEISITKLKAKFVSY